MLCIVAGDGNLPKQIIEKLQQEKREFRLIIFKGYSYHYLPGINNGILNFVRCLLFQVKKIRIPIPQERIKKIGILDFDTLFEFFKKEKIEEVVFCGRVKFPGFLNILKNFSKLTKYFPELTTEDLKRITSGDDHLLRTILQLLEKKGLKIIAAQEILPYILVTKNDGFCGTRDVFFEEKIRDITAKAKVGLQYLEAISTFDLGQGVVMELDSGRIIAVEGAEGTNKLLSRSARYSSGEKIFIKVAKKGQDDRVDFPAIGVKTIKLLKKYNFLAICTKEKGLLIVDRPSVKNSFRKNNISLIVT